MRVLMMETLICIRDQRLVSRQRWGIKHLFSLIRRITEEEYQLILTQTGSAMLSRCLVSMSDTSSHHHQWSPQSSNYDALPCIETLKASAWHVIQKCDTSQKMPLVIDFRSDEV